MADKQEQWRRIEAEEWMKALMPQPHPCAIVTESGEGIAVNLTKEDADLIVALHNAALDIGDPIAVAENMSPLTNAAGAMLVWFRAQGYNRELPFYRVLEKYHAAITKPKGD